MPDHPETTKAKKVIGHAKDSVAGFLDAFEVVRKARDAGRGAPTDEEQDLARAALVFAAAGLDSCIKHLIKDSIVSLSNFDEKVGDLLSRFVRNLLEVDPKHRLVSALLAESSRSDLIDSYIYELTGSSLQSFDQLASASGALGIKVEILTSNKKDVQRIFAARNDIIHELHVNIDGEVGQRERNSRSKTQLDVDAKLLLSIAEQFIKLVNEKLDNA